MTEAPPPPAVRQADSHKGDYGRILIIGGSRGMAGAAALAGESALRSGAGLVTVATAESAAASVAGHNPCYMTLPLPEDKQGRIAAGARDQLAAAFAATNVVAIGPGLGRSQELTDWVAELWETLPAPLVIDADGLNALAATDAPRQIAPAGLRVLTPHPGEFQRLCPESEPARDALEKAATAYARDAAAILVLKGHRSLVTDGRTQFHNTTGNPGMATGGAGDVLTGIAAAMLAGAADPLTAIRQSVHVHGLAGDVGAEQLGEISLTALDICRSLPAAFQAFAAQAPRP